MGRSLIIDAEARQVQCESTPKPVLKWAGGKTQLLPHLMPLVPTAYSTYIEPFFGGGALFFAIRPQRSLIADANPELINLYRVIKSDVEPLIECLRLHSTDKRHYYRVREQIWTDLSPVQAAARTIYLNRTCFNGLYRVNRTGAFNVPYGLYHNPLICDARKLRAVSEALRTAVIVEGDYKAVLREYAAPGDFIYLDPPYIPTSRFSDFKRYTKEQFHEEDHWALAREFRRLHALGCRVALTNSNVPLVHELFQGFEIRVVPTKRNISCNGDTRCGEDVIVVA